MPFEFAILAAFGAMACWGFGDYFIQKTTRKIGDIEALFWIGVIGSIALFPFVLPELPLLFSIGNASILLFLGVLTFFVAVLLFEAYKEGKLSVIDVLLEIELPITIFLAIIFYNETLSSLQYLIIGLVFAGILLISTPSLSLKSARVRLEKGLVLGIVAAVGLGVMNFLTGAGARMASPILAIWVPWVIYTVMCLVIIAKRKAFSKLFQDAKLHFKVILPMGVFDTAAWLLFAFALSSNSISLTTAITEAYPALALFLGVYLNKEAIASHQYIGAFLAIIACIFLGLILV
ncbi:MAG: DMT family transporter [Candidatus Diapherotrites archaeon]